MQTNNEEDRVLVVYVSLWFFIYIFQHSFAYLELKWLPAAPAVPAAHYIHMSLKWKHELNDVDDDDKWSY